MKAFAPAGLWRHVPFMKLWSAQTVSQLGTQVSLLAIPLIGAALLRLDPFAFALLGTAEFLPFLLFALPAGVVADRLPRRGMLIFADLGRAAVLATIPLAYVLGLLGVMQLYVVAFAAGTLTVLFEVAYLSYLPELVGRKDILEGNAKLEITRSASQIAGPGLAGLLIGIISAPIAILADSASFVVSAGFVLGIPKTKSVTPPAQAAASVGIGREIAEGLRFVLRHPLLRALAACTGISNLFSNLAFAIFVLYLVRELGLSAETIGFVLALGNIGLLAGAFAGRPLGAKFGVGWTIIVSAAFFGPSLVLLALAPAFPSLSVTLITAGLFIGLFAQVSYNINQVSLRQAVTPDAMLGRMNATMRFIVWGTIPIGELSGGILASVFGLVPAIAVGAVGGMFGFVPLLLSPMRSVREIPSSPDAMPGDAARNTMDATTELASGESMAIRQQRGERNLPQSSATSMSGRPSARSSDVHRFGIPFKHDRA
jgi:MFS family permease